VRWSLVLPPTREDSDDHTRRDDHNDPPYEPAAPFDEAQLAAAAFLARYSGRTLDAHRHDLRSFFQWASDQRLAVLDATRPHI
jgi:hypothetical protein